MLDKLDICCLFDAEYTDGAGLRRTRDRSRHGIHPLVGDGTTASTMPTWDADRGLYLFDGGDYLTFPQSEDVDGVLAGMGSIQDETYCWLMDPWIEVVAGQITEFMKKDNGAGVWFRLREQFGASLTFYFNGAGAENQSVAAPLGAWDYRRVLITATRRNGYSAIYANDTLLVGGAVVSQDASNAGDLLISSATASYLFKNGTGLRFFGYGRFVATPTYLNQLNRNLRGLL